MCILKVVELHSGYGAKEIIKGITFSVKKGELFGIIGPNGAGKTTLFRTLSGILKPMSGYMLYMDKDITKISPRDLAKKVSVIPQFLEMPFSFFVEDFVLMGRFPHIGRFEPMRVRDYEILEEVMNFTDIQAFRKKKISELSGGQRQRVILAQGFAQQPELLILDEPISHLDIAHQIQILDLVKRLNRLKALTVIMSIQDLNLASQYCNRILLIADGKVRKIGYPEEVIEYDTIKSVYKTEVIIDNNPITGRPYIFVVPEQYKIHLKDRIDKGSEGDLPSPE